MAKLTDEAADALKVENQFLAGVTANIEEAKSRYLRGSTWQTVEKDDNDALRAQMASKRMYDRSLLKQMPKNRVVSINGYEKRFIFWKRQTGSAIASVVSRFDDLLEDGGPSQPMSLNELTEHIRQIAPDPKVRAVVGVCATSGFTEEARSARHEYPNMDVVLVEPLSGGGWKVTADESVPKFVREMFDPEDIDQKLDRVRQEVERRGTDLLTGGLASDRIAQDVGLPVEVVNRALDRIAKSDPELRVSKSKEGRLLYRGAAVVATERTSMSFVDRIKDMFAKEGDEVAKINMLSERRAALAQRRNRLYEEIASLEEKESDLLKQGRENKSAVVRRRLVAQIAQLRKDIARQNTTANMLNQQINIISTDVHNLTLIQQGEAASLPDTQELTENAVRAEEMLETLKADSDLVSSLETGVGEALVGSEEADILAEFDEPLKAESASTSSTPKQTSKPAADTSFAMFDEEAEAPKTEERKPADPEAS
ncbi:MAG: hypothetical protein DHS20C16_31230 [Phycisphaerae bacterium]|nr:MAG: hypothetical protein DHS20C16_31230 [Phycisphaerae bacterium]